MALSLSTGRYVTLQDALRNERNILQMLRRRTRTAELSDYLWLHRSEIQTITAHHLGLREASQCIVTHQSSWMCGQFNICVVVLVTMNNGAIVRKIFRCPLPHKVGEPFNAGTIDEKVRTEAANYAWIELNCHDIPTPRTIAFGLSTGQHFTHQKHLPWYHRISFIIRRVLRSTFFSQTSSPYSLHHCSTTLGISYILLDFVEEATGTMLSDSWPELRHDATRRETLYRGLSRLMLSLAQQAHSRIGSLRVDDNGCMSLASRPVFCSHTILESEGAPKIEGLYSRNAPFLAALMQFRRDSFLSQPNAVNDEEDCRLQMSHLTLLEAILPRTVDMHYEGPYVLQFTDLHASNIFVDENWNITAVIDLEFVCALPPSMLDVPYWLTTDSIDDAADHMEDFVSTFDTFMRVFDEEESRLSNQPAIGSSIRAAWESGAYWVYHCLTSVNTLPSIVEDQLYPMFGFVPSLKEQEAFHYSLSQFWSREDSQHLVARKLADKQRYDDDLRQLYSQA